MDILKEIKSKTDIDIELLTKRLSTELSTTDENKEMLNYAIYDTLIIILDVTHQYRVRKCLYTTWINMIKDYWYLNKYDKLGKNNEGSGESESQSESTGDVKSITQGNEKIEFYEKSSTVEINGTLYKTGTIDFTTNLLREKYKEDLYRHRRMRWSH